METGNRVPYMGKGLCRWAYSKDFAMERSSCHVNGPVSSLGSLPERVRSLSECGRTGDGRRGAVAGRHTASSGWKSRRYKFSSPNPGENQPYWHPNSAQWNWFCLLTTSTIRHRFASFQVSKFVVICLGSRGKPTLLFFPVPLFSWVPTLSLDQPVLSHH